MITKFAKLAYSLGTCSLLLLAFQKYAINSAFGSDDKYTDPSIPDVSRDDNHTQKIINQMTCNVLFKLEKSRLFSFLSLEEFKEISADLEELKRLVAFEESDLGSLKTAMEDTVELNSFCSFQDLPEQPEDDLCQSVLILYRKNPESIRSRQLWTSHVGLDSDEIYLVRLYCVRRSFEKLILDPAFRLELYNSGKHILARISDQNNAVMSNYDELFHHIRTCSSASLRRELEIIGLVEFGLYDFVFDYVLLKLLQLANDPPYMLVRVIDNRFLPGYVKEAAFTTVVMSLISIKRHLLADGEDPTQFRRLIYSLAEKVIPPFAWGLFRPDSIHHCYCNVFKEALSCMFTEIYCHDSAFSSLDTLSAHIRSVVLSKISLICDDT